MSAIATDRSHVKPGIWSKGRLPLNHSNFALQRVLVVVLCLSAFGPYVLGSIRTEQLAVYAMAPLVLFTFVNLQPWAFGLLATWSGMVLISLLGVAFPYRGATPWTAGSLLAGLDNWALPLMAMLGVWSLVPPQPAARVLRTAGHVVVAATAANAVLAMALSVQPTIALFLQSFWSGQESGTNVGLNSMMMGRYSGIFGQPADAGLMYAIAALMAVWLYNKNSPVRLYGALSLIGIGGALSVSKIFLLVGAPLVLIYLWRSRGASGRTSLFVLGGAVIAGIGATGFLQSWDGLDYLTRLFEAPASGSAIELYTANRWNEGSGIMQIMGFMLQASPLIGMGMAGLNVAYDSLWTEALVQGGLLACVGMVAAFALLLMAFSRIDDKALREFAFFFWVILVGASFGIPALSTNRVATVVWVVAALLVAVAHAKPARIEGRNRPA